MQRACKELISLPARLLGLSADSRPAPIATNFDPNRKITIQEDSWIRRHIHPDDLGNAYQHFLKLRSLLRADSQAEQYKNIRDEFDGLLLMFDIIESFGTVTPEQFFKHNIRGSVQYHPGASRIPRYNSIVAVEKISQLCNTMLAFLKRCGKLKEYKHNCHEATICVVELTKFVYIIKGAHKTATKDIGHIEIIKHSQRKRSDIRQARANIREAQANAYKTQVLTLFNSSLATNQSQAENNSQKNSSLKGKEPASPR